MKHERIGAATPKNGNPGLLCGSREYLAESGEKVHIKAALNATSPSGVRIIKADFSRFLDGNPSVAMEWRGCAILVGLTSIPWGWKQKGRPREFYDEQSAYLHAARLLRDIAKAGQDERDRRERNRLMRLQEREAAR